MAYCIAFSYDGCTDVTRRYVRNPQTQLLPRVRCPEGVLLWILQEIRKAKRENLSKQDLFRLEKEDIDEEQELRAYQVSALAMEIGDIGPNTGLPTGLPFDPVREEEKRPRQSGKSPSKFVTPKKLLMICRCTRMDICTGRGWDRPSAVTSSSTAWCRKPSWP